MVGSPSFMKLLHPCWKSPDFRSDHDAALCSEGAHWFKDLGHHSAGDFSLAMVQANHVMEDSCQIESGPLSFGKAIGPQGTFVGVYDGHGGPETSRYLTHRLLENLKRLASDHPGMSINVIRKAFSDTDEEFISFVRRQWMSKPKLASVGSCCLVGIVSCGMLYVANAGDSRAVLGRYEQDNKGVTAVQMCAEHNAGIVTVRQELLSLHPDDPQIVAFKHDGWRVKGIIQVSRSIGDAFLKDPYFNRPPLLPRFQVPEPFQGPILRSEPSIVTHRLSPEDKFLIFASDGLWDFISNQDAVNMIHNSPRNGIARKLIKVAIKEAARKHELRYTDVDKLDGGIRRHFHDDLTVIVLFLDDPSTNRNNAVPVVSIKGPGAPASAPSSV